MAICYTLATAISACLPASLLASFALSFRSAIQIRTYRYGAVPNNRSIEEKRITTNLCSVLSSGNTGHRTDDILIDSTPRKRRQPADCVVHWKMTNDLCGNFIIYKVIFVENNFRIAWTPCCVRFASPPSRLQVPDSSGNTNKQKQRVNFPLRCFLSKAIVHPGDGPWSASSSE